MALSDVDTAMAAANAALSSADYDAAILHATKALGYLATIPDSQKSGRGLSWDRQSIDNYIARVERIRTRAMATSSRVQQTKITWANPS